MTSRRATVNNLSSLNCFCWRHVGSCSLFFHHTDVFLLRWWAAVSFCCRCINKVLIAVMFLLIDFLSDENVRRRRGSVVSLHYNHQGPAAEAAAARVNTWRGRDGRQTSPGSISARKLYFDKCYRSEKHVNTCKCQQFTPIWRLLIKRMLIVDFHSFWRIWWLNKRVVQHHLETATPSWES